MRRYVKQLLCKNQKVREIKRESLDMRNVFAVCSSGQLWDVIKREAGSVFSAIPTSLTDFALDLCKHSLPSLPCASPR